MIKYMKRMLESRMALDQRLKRASKLICLVALDGNVTRKQFGPIERLGNSARGLALQCHQSCLDQYTMQ